MLIRRGRGSEGKRRGIKSVGGGGSGVKVGRDGRWEVGIGWEEKDEGGGSGNIRGRWTCSGKYDGGRFISGKVEVEEEEVERNAEIT